VLEFEDYIAAEAKERQRKAGKLYGENHPKQEVLPLAEEPLSSDQSKWTCEVLADLAGVSKSYMNDASVAYKIIPKELHSYLAKSLYSKQGVLTDFNGVWYNYTTNHNKVRCTQSSCVWCEYIGCLQLTIIRIRFCRRRQNLFQVITHHHNSIHNARRIPLSSLIKPLSIISQI